MSENGMKSTTILALLGATLLWGFSFVVTKIALDRFDQFTLVFTRFVTTSIFFTVLFISRGFPRLPRRTHGRLILLALFEPVLYFLAETAGLERTTAAKASLIIATIPGMVLLASRIVLRERAGSARVFGALVSIAGVVILVIGDPGIRINGLNGAVGDILIVGAVLSAVGYMLITRSLAGTVQAVDITGFQFMYGTAIFLPIYLINAHRQDWSAVDGQGIIAILYLIIFASIGAFLCYNYALTKTQASRAAVYLNGIPIIATIGGWALLGERMAPIQAVGAAIVIIGIFIVSKK